MGVLHTEHTAVVGLESNALAAARWADVNASVRNPDESRPYD